MSFFPAIAAEAAELTGSSTAVWILAIAIAVIIIAVIAWFILRFTQVNAERERALEREERAREHAEKLRAEAIRLREQNTSHDARYGKRPGRPGATGGAGDGREHRSA